MMTVTIQSVDLDGDGNTNFSFPDGIELTDQPQPNIPWGINSGYFYIAPYQWDKQINFYQIEAGLWDVTWKSTLTFSVIYGYSDTVLTFAPLIFIESGTVKTDFDPLFFNVPIPSFDPVALSGQSYNYIGSTANDTFDARSVSQGLAFSGGVADLGAGDDRFYSGVGDDNVNCGVGNDIVGEYMQGGKDVFNGGDGMDTFYADLSLLVYGLNFSVDAEIQFDNIILKNFESFELSMTSHDDLLDFKRTNSSISISADPSIIANWIDFLDGDDTVVFNQHSLGRHNLSGGNGIDTLTIDIRNSSVSFSSINPDWYRIYDESGVRVDVFFDGFECVNFFGGQNDDYFDGKGIGSVAHRSELDGGGGNDNLSYAYTLTGGDGDDILYGGVILNGGEGVDELHARSLGSTLNGDSGDDFLIGSDSRDLLFGGEGADTINGASGVDTIYFSSSQIGVRVNLLLGNGNLGDAEGDTYFDVENITGSSKNDALFGSNVVNKIEGASGNDVLFGYGGNDVLIGGIGNDTLRGGLGADYINGGSGLDTVDYISSTASGVTINLFNGTGLFGEAQGDTLINVENVRGSVFDDILTGTSKGNVLRGSGGNDTLSGLGGRDYFQYNGASFGNDNITDFIRGVDILDFRSSGLLAVNMIVQLIADDTVISFAGHAGHSIALDNFVGTLNGSDFLF